MTKKDKREIILKALEKVLKDRRYDEVTVEQVAEKAGVGKGTVYRYFRDKEDLFFQMIQEFLAQELDAVKKVAISDMSPRERLIKAGSVMSDHIQRHGHYIRMMHAQQFARNRQGRCKIMREHHDHLNGMLEQIMDDAIEAGVIRKDVDKEAVFCVYKGTIMERSILAAWRNTELSIDYLIELLFEGLGI